MSQSGRQKVEMFGSGMRTAMSSTGRKSLQNSQEISVGTQVEFIENVNFRVSRDPTDLLVLLGRSWFSGLSSSVDVTRRILQKHR